MAASTHGHHTTPRYLLTLHEQAHTGEGIAVWMELETELARYGLPVEIDRDELEAVVRWSVVEVPADDHRAEHAGDFQRWGAMGGKETLRRYGRRWFSCLGRIRHGDREAREELMLLWTRRKEASR